MLQRLAVRNYQSITKLELELAPFTVVVGQSSSGKSALTRAIRTLVSNARGTSFITHGERTCTITATTDRGTVSLTRGSKDEYTLINAQGNQFTFTKLGGDVPEHISTALGIPPKDPINFAGQFDMPYLLKASPSEVARILGELTNADIVFSAARESNRRRLQASSALKVKADDLAQINEQAQSFARLRDQLDAIATAESHLHTAAELEARHAALDDLLRLYEDALEKRTTASWDAEMLLPDLGPATAAQERLDLFIALLERSARGKRAVDQAEEAIQSAGEELDALERAYIAALHELGTCPTCGQNTGGVTHAS